MRHRASWALAQAWIWLARGADAVMRAIPGSAGLALRTMRACERRAAIATARAIGAELDTKLARLRETGR